MAATASRSFSKKGRERREGREGVVSTGASGYSFVRPKGRNGRTEPSNGQSPLGNTLERLTQVNPGRHRVVTCYLKLEPRDRARGKYLIKMKNRVKFAIRDLPRLQLERTIADEVQRDLN